MQLTIIGIETPAGSGNYMISWLIDRQNNRQAVLSFLSENYVDEEDARCLIGSWKHYAVSWNIGRQTVNGFLESDRDGSTWGLALPNTESDVYDAFSLCSAALNCVAARSIVIFHNREWCFLGYPERIFSTSTSEYAQ